MTRDKELETATHIGVCYLCGQRIYTNDTIQTWTVNQNPVAAHVACVESNLAGGQSEEKP